MCISKWENLISTSHQWAAFSHFSGSRASACAVLAPEGKNFKNKEFPPISPPFFSFYIWADLTWHGRALWLPWLSCVPPQADAHSQPLAAGQCWETAVMQCQPCPAVARTPVAISTSLGTNAKHSTVRAAQGKWAPSQPDPIHLCMIFNKDLGQN